MARIVMLCEESFIEDLKAAKDFDVNNSIVGVADEDVEIAQSVNDIIYKDFGELIEMFPSSVFFTLRENHEQYIGSVCGEFCVSRELMNKISERQSPIRRRLL